MTGDLGRHFCHGFCCEQKRIFNKVHSKVAPSFTKLPKPNSLSVIGYGQHALDTSATIHMLTAEHAGNAPIKELRRPIFIRGVSKNMTTSVTQYFIHQIYGLCLVSDRISILSYYMLLAMGWRVDVALKEKIVLKHSSLRNELRQGMCFYRNERIYVSFDQTLITTWVPNLK